MNFSSNIMRSWRLNSQQLSVNCWQKPEQAVKWLGGVQAQNYDGGKWSIGLRADKNTEDDVEAAIRDQRIVRTWMFRGTLHFVAAEDLGWLTALLAPRIIKNNARRYKQLNLDEDSFRESQQALRQAIQRNGPLTRPEIKTLFERQALPAEGQQVPYLLQRASLDGVICQGPQRDNEPTYTLLPDWIVSQPAMDPEQALASLAERYFSSHGPATIKDFAWWSGMTITRARSAVESSSVRLLEEGDFEYWGTGDEPVSNGRSFGCLLPGFDEFILGYKDRSLVLNPAYTKRVNPGGGMLKPTVVVNGQVLGIWSYKKKRNKMTVSIQPFRDIESSALTLIEKAAKRLGSFMFKPIELRFA